MNTHVGIFDSGVGGLTVVAALRARAPRLALTYLADGAAFPYGDLEEAAVAARTEAAAAHLVEREGCGLVVVACNTATSAVLPRLRARFAVPFVGMEPPVKPALERTRTDRVLALVTPGTAKGERLAALTRRLGDPGRVHVVPMPDLADLVEAGDLAGAAVEAALRAALEGPGHGADHIVLGCTHYGFLRDRIQELAGPEVDVVDAADPVARRVLDLLRLPPREAGAPAPVHVATTGDPSRLRASLEALARHPVGLPPIEVRGTPVRLGPTGRECHSGDT